MAKKRPAEFPSDWHYEAHLEALAREIQGYKNNLIALDALPPDPEGQQGARDLYESGLKHAQLELDHYTQQAKTASKRPKAEAKVETR